MDVHFKSQIQNCWSISRVRQTQCQTASRDVYSREWALGHYEIKFLKGWEVYGRKGSLTVGMARGAQKRWDFQRKYVN